MTAPANVRKEDGTREQDRRTPMAVVRALAFRHAGGGFDLDVAANTENAKAERFFSLADDGLAQRWVGRIWCNPPYDNIAPWVHKAIEEVGLGYADVVVFLLPSRTDQGWYHEALASRLCLVEHIEGRINFLDTHNQPMSGAFEASVVIVVRRPLVAKELCAEGTQLRFA